MNKRKKWSKQKEYSREYYLKNKEKILEKVSKYKLDNKEIIKIKSKKYLGEYARKRREKDKDKTIEYRKKHWIKNKEVLSKIRKEKYWNNRDEILAKNREYQKDKLPIYHLNSKLKRFKITKEQLEQMETQQNNCCAICGNPETVLNNSRTGIRKLAIDHDHITGKIRSLLCIGCNTALGGFKDNIDLLYKAIEYLKKHQEKKERVYEFTNSCS